MLLSGATMPSAAAALGGSVAADSEVDLVKELSHTDDYNLVL
jgi:hypothetical protein